MISSKTLLRETHQTAFQERLLSKATRYLTDFRPMDNDMNASAVTRIAFFGERVEVATDLSFDDTLQRLFNMCGKATMQELADLASAQNSETAFTTEVEQRFVGESGFMVFNQIDHGSWISIFGVSRRVRRILLGNPLIAITIIKHDISAGLFVPVELLISESPDKSGCVITYVRPSSMIFITDNQDLSAAANALDLKLDALVLAATTRYV